MATDTPDTTGATRPAVVVGAGLAGLMAAEAIARAGQRVVVRDASPSPARKFLLAGRGGLNLTHSEPLATLLTRYGEAADRLRPAIEAFPPEALRRWASGLGEETFVGSSGRVFPKSFKATPLLRAWLRRLDRLGVALKVRSRFVGFGEGGALRFVSPAGEETVEAAAAVFASRPSRRPRRVAARRRRRAFPRGRRGGCAAEARQLRLRRRLVGGGAPALRRGASEKCCAHPRRRARARRGDHHRDRPRGRRRLRIVGRLTRRHRSRGRDGGRHRFPAGRGRGRARRKARSEIGPIGLDAVAQGGVRACRVRAHARGGAVPEGAEGLAARAKRCPIRLVGTAPMARAISTAGGVAWSGIDPDFMLIRRPGVFVAGEMIDWEAPTGGYLMQASFSIGAAAGRAAARFAAATGANLREPSERG